MTGVTAAFAATGLYYVGFAVFKVAAGRMAPLRGNQIPRLALTMLSSWIFLLGLVLVLGGLWLQIIALARIPLSEGVPIFVSGLVPLLVIAVVFFGERLALREWLGLALIAAAMLLIAVSIGSLPPITAHPVPLWKLAAVVVPALCVPLLLVAFGDTSPDGRHARPVAGIAFGLASGLPVGTAELAIKGWGDAHAKGFSILSTPYPYVTVLAAAAGFGIMQVGFQRCRVAIIATVMTISAKSYLLLVGALLYGEPWPSDKGRVWLRVFGFAVAGAAVLAFPRHETVRPVRQ
jgi:multidrug transporter EmrE-like cation transporter